MSKRAAILDLGTNTFHLLIAESDDGRLREIYKDTVAVKLGEGGINRGLITAEAMQRGLAAIQRFHSEIQKHKVENVRALGTAAIRSARNGDELIDQIFSLTGIRVQTIEGDKEAELIYKGVRAAVTITSEPVLIMDIGGGSVEFILCDNKGIYWMKSYSIGAAKLMERFHHTDPISVQEIETIRDYLDETLSDLRSACSRLRPHSLIGSAGAFETFAELVSRRFSLPHERLKATGFDFNFQQFQIIAEELLRSTHDERAANKAITPVRVDMIIVATVLTCYVLETFSIGKLQLSTYSLKEGAFYDLFEK